MISMTEEMSATKFPFWAPEDIQQSSEKAMNFWVGALSPYWVPFWAASGFGLGAWAMSRNLMQGEGLLQNLPLAARWPGFTAVWGQKDFAPEALEVVTEAPVDAVETVIETVAPVVEAVEKAAAPIAVAVEETIEPAVTVAEKAVEPMVEVAEPVIDPVAEAPVVPTVVEAVAEPAAPVKAAPKPLTPKPIAKELAVAKPATKPAPKAKPKS
ncbi:MAG: hypothetical protein WDN06_19825 [Asticcacaulis sp.]